MQPVGFSENQSVSNLFIPEAPKRILCPFGAAGCGKGTLIEDALRALPGRSITAFPMSKFLPKMPGQLVPDNVVVAAFEPEYRKRVALGVPQMLDGIPRTEMQVEALVDINDHLRVQGGFLAIWLDIDEETSIDRQFDRGVKLRGTGARADIPQDNQELLQICMQRAYEECAQQQAIAARFEIFGVPVIKLDANRSPEEVWQDVLLVSGWSNLPRHRVRHLGQDDGLSECSKTGKPVFASTADA